MSRLPPQGISSPGRKRRVAELFAELLGRSFLPFPHFAAVDHHIMGVALSLDLDLAKFDQSCFHISMFRWLELQAKYWEIIADNLSASGWTWGCASHIDSTVRALFTADARRDNGKRFIVSSDEKLTAFLELEKVTRDGVRPWPCLP